MLYAFIIRHRQGNTNVFSDNLVFSILTFTLKWETYQNIEQSF